MVKILTEDQVRDRDKILLGFDCIERYVKQGTGQITTFNQLGIKGINNRPDGWYIPDNKNNIAILLETKSSKEDIGTKKCIDEIKKNCAVLLNSGWKKVVGILHIGSIFFSFYIRDIFKQFFKIFCFTRTYFETNQSVAFAFYCCP